MKQKLRKPLAWLLTLAILITMLPGAVLAAETDSLCEHENPEKSCAVCVA